MSHLRRLHVEMKTRERSQSNSEGKLRDSFTLAPMVRLYYRLKRFIPQRIRLAMRKAHASRILTSCQNHWPISESAGEKPSGWPGWPDSCQFAFILTHDVERRLGLERVVRLAELEMECGFRSSFNFVPEGEYSVPPELRAWLIERGFEVGVHDLHHDGTLYTSKRSFEKNAKRVNHYLREWDAVGFRAGFMLHNLAWAHDLEVLYEASTFDTDPFEPQPDGAHTIFPFWVSAPPDPLDGSAINGDRGGYVELPYTLPQDSTVFIHLAHKTIDLWKRKLEWIVERGGMALLIVHPDYTSFDGRISDSCEFSAELYREFLEFVRQQYFGQYWHVLPREVAAYCRDFKPLRPSIGVPLSMIAGALLLS